MIERLSILRAAFILGLRFSLAQPFTAGMAARKNEEAPLMGLDGP
jgi:hypothetical protein